MTGLGKSTEDVSPTLDSTRRHLPSGRPGRPHADAAQTRSSANRGKYLVALKPDSSRAQLRDHTSWALGVHARNLRNRQASVDIPVGVERTFSFEGFRAYSGSFDEEAIEDIERSQGMSLGS